MDQNRTMSGSSHSLSGRPSRRLPGWLYWIGLLLLCAAYLQGGLVKAFDFAGAVAEMRHFGTAPAAPLAGAVIVLELGASLMILLGWWRWLGALMLGLFTLGATFLALPFWNAPPEARFMMANGFFEHLGLVGGFVLVAWRDRSEGSRA